MAVVHRGTCGEVVKGFRVAGENKTASPERKENSMRRVEFTQR